MLYNEPKRTAIHCPLFCCHFSGRRRNNEL
nr:MAG TPA: hypothetical protein [Caudoviricetes sp.]